MKIYHAVGLTSYLTGKASMDFFRRSTSIIFTNKNGRSRAARRENDFTSVIYNVTGASHDANGCGETVIPHKVKPQTQTKIMAKKIVKSKPAPKKAAAKKTAKKK